MLRSNLFAIGILAITACNKDHASFDASGVFEAREVIVSAEASGQIVVLNAEEGTRLKANQSAGKIDCKDLELYRAQVQATKEALMDKRINSSPDVNILRSQITQQEAEIASLSTKHAVLIKERERQQRLFAQDAAPAKTLDDLNGEIDVLERQIDAAKLRIDVLKQQIQSTESSIQTKNRGILSDTTVMQSQIERIAEQILECEVINPFEGTVLARYVETYEFVNTGEPLYKLADLTEMTLRAYITGDQLTGVRLGQNVKVLVDEGEKKYRTYEGVITWIADEAEFTPKTIQTKKERAHLVYALKVSVPNDGLLRIGMYGEIELSNED